MGIYLNPRNENFRRTLAADIYVDKTMMLNTLEHFMDKGNNYVCVSRPRRFGKTTAQNMISAFYSKGCDSKDLFKNLKISTVQGYDRNMNMFNVIQIDMNSEYQSAEIKDHTIRNLIRKIKREIRKQFPDLEYYQEDTLSDMMLRVFEEKHETFIILIDEYDVLVREQVNAPLFSDYLSFLNALFKSNTLRPAISLAYITGILPVVRDKVQSKLNNFKEYTILDARDLAQYVGFTGPEVMELCRKYNIDYAQCRLWYDGYRQHEIEIYNPESVVESITTGIFASYWGRTSSYQVISDRLDANFEGMRDDVIEMLAGGRIQVDVDRYINTMTDFKGKDEAFTYLIHTGYLAYNLEDGTCRIPNNEIRREWRRAITGEDHYKVTDQIIGDSRRLLEETWAGNEEAVAKALDRSHIHVTSNRSYNNEDALQCAIYLAYFDALNEYTVIREMTAGKGFADMVYIPVEKGIHPAMIIELKRNHTAGGALSQIKEKRYFDSLRHYQGNLLFVGVNYDEDTKTHTCHIEKFHKE